MKVNDTLFLKNTINQNPILARRAWFWHVASQIYLKVKITLYKSGLKSDHRDICRSYRPDGITA